MIMDMTKIYGMGQSLRLKPKMSFRTPWADFRCLGLTAVSCTQLHFSTSVNSWRWQSGSRLHPGHTQDRSELHCRLKASALAQPQLLQVLEQSTCTQGVSIWISSFKKQNQAKTNQTKAIISYYLLMHFFLLSKRNDKNLLLLFFFSVCAVLWSPQTLLILVGSKIKLGLRVISLLYFL